jgi:hypothetical protein
MTRALHSDTSAADTAAAIGLAIHAAAQLPNPNIFKVPRGRVAELVERLEKLARRAAKLGVQLPTVEVVREWQESRSTRDPQSGELVTEVRRWSDVRVTGEAPRLNGWHFLATIQHSEFGNVVKRVPHAETTELELTPFRHTDARRCDHCKAIRRRVDTFVVRHEDGRTLQVGRSCLRDFLGHKSPQAIANFCSYLIELVREASEWGGGWHVDTSIELEHYMACVAASIRQAGWVSGAAARDSGDTSTANHASWLAVPPSLGVHPEVKRAWREAQPTEGDAERARKLLWTACADLDALTERNDYQHNLYVALRAGRGRIEVDRRGNPGIVASAARYAERILDEISKRERAPSRHVGTVGKRIDLKVTVRMHRSWENNFGTTHLYKFTDAEGNDLVWFASRCQDINEGDELELRGTVKAHGDYNGRAQTTLTRCIVRA